MLCDNCKNNEANVKYTQVINGVKKEMNLCEECSQKLGITNNWSMPIDFSSFLGDFMGDYTQAFSPLIADTKVIKCNKCNRTYNDFIETGKFGCDNCYEVFFEIVYFSHKKYFHHLQVHNTLEERKDVLHSEQYHN